MKISLAIPVYQQSNFLPFALESIRVQYADIKLALMDATPDDSVQKVLENYRDLLSYHRYGPDAGQTSAIQEGWDNTDGEIIAWLCADDYYFPYVIDEVRKIFIDQPDVDVVYGDSVFVDEFNRFLGYFPAIKRDISFITRECCISQPSCFVRRTAFEKIGGHLNTKLHYIMDWDLWVRLYHSRANFYYLNKPLSVVRMYEGTKTSSRSWQRFFEISHHLFLNTNPFSAVRSLIGFYYQNLLISQGKGFNELILKLLNFCRNQKRCYFDSANVSNCFNYGLSDKNNVVATQVNVYLPWYSDSLPNRLCVNCDLDIEPIAYLNGVQLQAETGSKYCYTITDANITTHLLHVKLSSKTNSIWHLHNVKFF